MDKKTVGLIATIATALLCGCPGLFLCVFGIWGATGTMPYTNTVNGYSNSGTAPASVGFAMLCMALIFIAIPIAVGFFTLRKKPEEAVPPPVNDGPIPPAS